VGVGGIRKECIEVTIQCMSSKDLWDVNFSLLGSAGAAGILGTAQPASSARVTPDSFTVAGFGASVPATDANRLVTAVLVNRDQVATKVVFAREGTTAARVFAYVGLDPIGIVSGEMCLQVESTSEGSWAIGALILLARVI